MCILFIYTDPTGSENGYKLILASNRDEYYTRPALPAHYSVASNAIGGEDMEKGREGGMWLGASLNKTDDYNFRLGVLLNVTGEEHRHDVEGRGVIVVQYLQQECTAGDYTEKLQRCGNKYNAFNFVAVDLSGQDSTVAFTSNSPSTHSVFKGKQTLGFGNSPVKTPLTKVKDGKERFDHIISLYNNVEQKDKLIDELLQLLKWEERHLPDPELQRRAPNAFEFLSSVYVKLLEGGYGTRTHTIILVDQDGNVDFIESTMKEPICPENPEWSTQNIKAHL